MRGVSGCSVDRKGLVGQREEGEGPLDYAKMDKVKLEWQVVQSATMTNPHVRDRACFCVGKLQEAPALFRSPRSIFSYYSAIMWQKMPPPWCP